jgi:IS5 family transposase
MSRRTARPRAEKGEQNQAIGRSRGGRNAKIHAPADARGRLLSILLSGGGAHDCPPARRLIRRVKAAAKLRGDKAYDVPSCARGSAIVTPKPSRC